VVIGRLETRGSAAIADLLSDIGRQTAELGALASSILPDLCQAASDQQAIARANISEIQTLRKRIGAQARIDPGHA